MGTFDGQEVDTLDIVSIEASDLKNALLQDVSPLLNGLNCRQIGSENYYF